MNKAIIPTAAIILSLSGTVYGQNRKPSSDEVAQRLSALISAGKISDAISEAKNSPDTVRSALAIVMAETDDFITMRKLAEAQSAIESALGFVDAYREVSKGEDLPDQALKGRQLRLQGIQYSDNKDYAKAETVLREALEISRQADDSVLEAGIHNNIGYALRSQDKLEKAAEQFDTARKLAEEQQDHLRAGSYNFNLGGALLDLSKADLAFQAFERSAQQNGAASRTSLEARAILMQGVALGRVNSVSAEPLKYFGKAQKMFEKLGDYRNCGWSFYLMGDHTAYSFNFAEAAALGEKAIPYLKKAKDNAGLLRCYTLLSDMYGRLEQKEKADIYRKLAKEISPQ